ncbi:MAG: hypothetical protein V3W34_06405 [Phycisphaerae bacterium]
MGILVLMMALAGQVFTISIDSTRQASALMEVNQSIRMLEETLREDLAGIDPARSMLVIQANPIDAYWTADQKSIDPDGDPSDGYPHQLDPERDDVLGGIGINGTLAPPYRLEKPRADVLMFFTSSRKTTSAVVPSISSNLVQVVYGHAELGELDNTGSWTTGPTQFPALGTAFAQPAESWHLARRSVVIVDLPQFNAGGCYPPPAPLPLPLPPLTQYADGPDDSGLPGANVDMLIEGRMDVIAQPCGGGPLFFQPGVLDTGGRPATAWYSRSRLDLTPPPAVADRLAHYFLPKCASFKVEWTISGKPGVSSGTNVVWRDPYDTVLYPPGHPLEDRYNEYGPPIPIPELKRRFGNIATPVGIANADVIGRGTPVWYATDPRAGVDTEDPFFPTALRITVDLFPQGGRLDRPMRHVMVIPIGSES